MIYFDHFVLYRHTESWAEGQLVHLRPEADRACSSAQEEGPVQLQPTF